MLAFFGWVLVATLFLFVVRFASIPVSDLIAHHTLNLVSKQRRFRFKVRREEGLRALCLFLGILAALLIFGLGPTTVAVVLDHFVVSKAAKRLIDHAL